MFWQTLITDEILINPSQNGEKEQYFNIHILVCIIEHINLAIIL